MKQANTRPYTVLMFALLAAFIILFTLSSMYVLRTQRKIRTEHTYLEVNYLSHTQSLNRLVFSLHRLLSYDEAGKTEESVIREKSWYIESVVTDIRYVQDTPADTIVGIFTEDPLDLVGRSEEYTRRLHGYYSLLTASKSRVDEAVGRRAILAEMESFETVGKEVMEFLEAYNHLLVQFDDYIFSHLLKRLDGYSGILRGYIISHTLTFVILVLAAFIYFSLIRRTNIALRKSREELEILVAERTQDLEEKGKSLQAALKDKEFLLREIDHRVKNNLAMVSSLINLHLADEDNPVNRKRLEDLGGQIGSISMIHENLHRTDQVHYVRLKEYLEDLLVRAFSLGMYRIRLDIHVEPEYLHSQQAVPLGLIINELATNSLKHGFNGAEDFVFRVVLEKDESTEEYILIISNNGKPFPEEIRLDNPSTLGLRLIAALVRQLGGTLSLKRRPYPEFMIRFPVESK